MGWSQIIGAVIGFVGVVIAAGPDLGSFATGWLFVAAIAPLSYAVGGFFINELRVNGFSVIVVNFGINLVGLICFSLMLAPSIKGMQMDVSPLMLVAAVLANCIAGFLLVWLAGRVTPMQLSFSNFSLVGCSVLVGAFVRVEVSIPLILGAVLVICSFWLAREKPDAPGSRRRREPRA
jgi:drug/metabolite transporter (DMT)-like permease